ncbi:DUF6188 family protein [Mycolicibacterium llatzerense]|uniref:Uncharacterized protein n=1 Tax=Mycolicibacterium llatzerense TaxID=280871 RepID=A0A0D1L4T8_9MYCO|nr:DUF6188 family protein [Mycolicibacterium llatzerense]KIU15920.1 hypothetical protein TL10_16705 [Mycolicibacterium llatzerense]MCT7369813.1 hypothetical protein [Mycolicibacterium llatzerense]
MFTLWIEQCTVQRMALHDGLVLDLADYNELVISRPLQLTLPATGDFPAEDVVIDPMNVAAHHRPLLDLAGSVCTQAWCTEGGALHLRFSRGHVIEVDADPHACTWELYGKRHGYMACLPGGRVRTVRYDRSDEDTNAEIAPATP